MGYYSADVKALEDASGRCDGFWCDHDLNSRGWPILAEDLRMTGKHESLETFTSNAAEDCEPEKRDVSGLKGTGAATLVAD